MALVDYSDSDSEPETTVQPTPAPAPAPKATPAAGAKKPFQKVIDRSKPGKIVVNLPQISKQDESETTDNSGQPPAKRARIGGGGGAFSGFNSFLPPPKNTGKPTVASSSSSSGKSAPRPGVNVKTGAAPGFSRESDDTYDEVGTKVNNTDSSESKQQQQQQQPSIPAGQKPADEVKLVGKPMMFKPLSVSRKPTKKNANKVVSAAKPASASVPSMVPATATEASPSSAAPAKAEPPPKKKVSLFSISDEPEEDDVVDNSAADDGIYEPMFSNNDADDLTTAEAFAQYDLQYGSNLGDSGTRQGISSDYGPQSTTTTTLDSLASDMNLSAAARRELFGRRGAPDPSATAARVINFNTDREYAHNEALRASGEGQQQTYNPVRAIAPGKHNLRQLVNQVHNQREALEESFAKGRSNKNEASARYGWR